MKFKYYLSSQKIMLIIFAAAMVTVLVLHSVLAQEDDVYIVSGNNLQKNSNFKVVLSEKLLSDLLIDNSSIYLNTQDFLYSVNKSSGVINYKVNINRIKSIKQTDTFVYAQTEYVVYQVNKSDGAILQKQIYSSLIDSIFTIFGLTGSSGLPGPQGPQGVPGANGTNASISNGTSANLTVSDGVVDLFLPTCTGNNFYQSSDNRNFTCTPDNDSGYFNSSNTTDNLSEGTTNKYYTDARARAALNATTPLSYNSSSGIFSITRMVPLTSKNINSCTDTTATTLKMMGFNVNYTAGSNTTGSVYITLTFQVYSPAAAATSTFFIRGGVGTAPSCNASSTGTQPSTTNSYSISSNGVAAAYSVISVAWTSSSLSPNTTYWFDIGVSDNTTDPWTFSKPQLAVIEQ